MTKKCQHRVSRPAEKPCGLCMGGAAAPPVGLVVAVPCAGVAGIKSVAAAATVAAAAGGSAAHIAAGAAAAAGGSTAYITAFAAGVAAGIGDKIGELDPGNTVPGGPVAGVTGIAGHKKSSSMKMRECIPMPSYVGGGFLCEITPWFQKWICCPWCGFPGESPHRPGL